MQALFVYAPVVHKALLDYCSEHPEVVILLLDNEAAQSENKFLERDIRALPATQIKTALDVYGVADVRIVDQRSIASVASEFEKVFVTEDEITKDFMARFAPKVVIEVIPLFIRWTKQISTTEYEVPPHREISEDEFAKDVLSKLDDEALKSPDWWRQIAAALVKDGAVLITAVNEHLPNQHTLTTNGDPRSNLDAGQGPLIYTSIHAEASVLSQAAKQGIATDGADLYVTTFPCPNCARLLITAGVQRVFYRYGYSLLDAEELLTGAGVEIILVK